MEIAVHIENLSVNYGQHKAIENINIDIPKGDFLGIIGPNGGGKSTFMKAVLGIIPIKTGKIQIFGENIDNCREKIGYVSQFSNVDRSFPITAVEVVMTGMIKKGIHPFHKYTEKQKALALEKLKLVGIEDLWDRQINNLSGGEFQRLLIARALASSPEILFLDEPTSSVDPASKESIFSLLLELNKNMTIVLITHDMLAISSKVKNIACLNEKMIYHGEVHLTNEVVQELYGCPVDLIAHGVPHRVLDCHNEEKK